MKIAILFSGRIFKFGNHYNNIMENLVQGHDVDFYLSHSPELKEDLETFSALYNPVAVCNDPIPEPDLSSYDIDREFIRPQNIFYMFYNRKRVFELLRTHMKTTGIKYDLIISHRLDVFCFEQLNLNLGPELCIPDDKNGAGINDQFALGSFESMESYMSVYDKMRLYLDSGTQCIAEAILGRHLQDLPIHRFPYKTAIIRDTEYSDHYNNTIFASGSCRLLSTIGNGRGKLSPIHSMFYNFRGINFLGKLHNIKQHIQFIQFINDEITIPESILSTFLTSYSGHPDTESFYLLPSKKSNIMSQ